MLRDENLVLEHELYERYDEMLDEVYGDAEIAGYTYSTSTALKRLDHVAYEQGFADWLDSCVKDGILFEEDGHYFSSDEESEEHETL